MLNAIEISPKVWWVGGIDWNERLFHGYTTERGITYNAYLIMDEKVTLIDCAKATFCDEFLQRIGQVIDPSQIDVVITNHVEMDHSGSLPKIHEIAPHAEFYASAPAGVAEIKAHYGFEVKGVKTGDTLNIGERTLTFVQTPMVHWPDNMVTYSDADQILFSNDAFGQHYATTKRFDDENDLCETMKQAKKYYANIVQPYGPQARKALEVVKGLDLKLIAPSHGVIWRSHISDILDAYESWTTNQVVVGSPTLNSQMLPNVAAFLTYMRGLSPRNQHRIGLAFGSYGWAPLGPKQVYAELENAKFQLPEPVITQQWIPKEADLTALQAKVKTLIEFEEK